MRLHRPPDEMAYDIVAGLKPPFSWLVRSAGGHWRFTDQGAQTEVEWRFHFELTSPLVYPLAFIVARGFFQAAQNRCLELTRQAFELST